MKNSLLRTLPIALIVLRLLLGFVLIFLSWVHIENYATIAISLLTIGLLSDIFDGIIARKLHIATQKLRRLDSTVDLLFFMAVSIATYIQFPSFFIHNQSKLIILFALEMLSYIVSYLKFKKEIATHTIGAKIWTLFLFATLVEIILNGQSTVLFTICFWIGILTRVEIIIIIFILKKWTNDVPSVYHSFQLRSGKKIKRNKLFN